ncbi:MAG: response regulator transcription factor [Bacillota bacterium]|nr:response regulator transcription factor [Bacillota bacterium]
MKKIKIVIADDQSIIRDGLKMILGMEEDLEIAGTASNGDEAFDLVEKLQPDIVLMDIRMPVCDGVLGTRKITDAHPEIKIIILTTFSDDAYIFEALKAGAKGYLLKDVQSDELADSIRMVMKGGMLIHPEAAAKVVRGLSSPQRIEDALDNTGKTEELTPRELEIVRLIGRGRTNKEISMELYISEGTVKNHITNILSKLYLRDRTQIAIYASQHKLS